MAQGEPFLTSLPNASDLQALVTNLNQVVIALNALNAVLTAALANVANSSG